jgi:2-polyprenyl-3-methyl-5-hydroxy-6-metoxy-1,4-benzoquinol methylase
MKEWFENWFNTDEYINVYRHRNEAEAELLIELILKNIDIPSGSNILDMACGAGRHSIFFAERGFEVTAVDLSEKLLSVAKQRAEKRNLKIDFIQADLRNFHVNKKFNLAVNLFTSFGYFQDDYENFSVFRDAHKLLSDNGYFVLDFFNSAYLIKNLIPESVEHLENSVVIQKRKIEGNRIVKNIIVNNNGGQKNYIESVRLYNPDELIKCILETGFEITDTFGDYHGNTFNSETSGRIIIIARK